MASGHPDWGQAQSAGLIATVSDLGEAAARLQSIDTLVRTGNVIWLDDFESNLNRWGLSVDGTGSSLVNSILTARSGSASVRFNAVAGAGNFAQIWHGFAVPFASRIGVEFSFAFISLFRLDLQVSQTVSGVQTNFFIRYDHPARTLAYSSDGGATFTPIVSGFKLFDSAVMWHTLKLVTDEQTGRFVRLYVDHVTYDLANIAGNSFAVILADHVIVRITVRADAALESLAYVDDFIFTINEP